MDEMDAGCRRDLDELDGRQGLGLDHRGSDRGHGLGNDGLLGLCAAACGHTRARDEPIRLRSLAEPVSMRFPVILHSPEL